MGRIAEVDGSSIPRKPEFEMARPFPVTFLGSNRLEAPPFLADTVLMEHLVSLGVGIGLAAACGFRVFVPLLVLSAAACTGHLQLSGGFEWIGTMPALVAFASATLLEIAAYYVPWVDNLLDTIAGPAAVVAGTVVTASALTDVDPFLKWSLAIIGGGGVAGMVSGGTALLRGASTLATAGFANPLVSTVEAVVALSLAALAILLPLIALGVVAFGVVYLAKRLLGRPRRAPA
jgi:hypothetical protein